MVPHPTTLPDFTASRLVIDAALDLLDPGAEHFRLADVARQEQQVVRRKLLREIQHRRLVGRRHHPELDVAGFGSDMQRIAADFACAHVDLSPSQESSFGHSRLMALAPATRLTWPPFSMISCLSDEPIFWINGLAAS